MVVVKNYIYEEISVLSSAKNYKLRNRSCWNLHMICSLEVEFRQEKLFLDKYYKLTPFLAKTL